MTVSFMSGFEAKEVSADGWTALVGSPTYSTTPTRTGAAAIRFNPASGGSAAYGISSPGTGWAHFGLYIASAPTVERVICNGNRGNSATLGVDSTGALTVRDASGGTLLGTSSVLSAGWHWIGFRLSAGTSVVYLQIDGADAVSGTCANTPNGLQIGPSGSEASAIDVYFDDVVTDTAGFLAPSSVALLVPTADSAKGTGWTNDAASTTSLFNAVDNKPPAGIADTTGSTGLHQIRNATSNANVNYDATMTTYTAAGINAGDTVLAVQPVIATGAPVTTSSKQGTVGVASNPTITNVALGSAGSAGAFWAGVTAGTFPTGWKVSQGTIAASPAVTLGTAPVMRVTQVTSSTRIAMACFMGILVAWTPAVVAASPREVYAVRQAANRASSF